VTALTRIVPTQSSVCARYRKTSTHRDGPVRPTQIRPLKGAVDRVGAGVKRSSRPRPQLDRSEVARIASSSSPAHGSGPLPNAPRSARCPPPPPGGGGAACRACAWANSLSATPCRGSTGAHLATRGRLRPTRALHCISSRLRVYIRPPTVPSCTRSISWPWWSGVCSSTETRAPFSTTTPAAHWLSLFGSLRKTV